MLLAVAIASGITTPLAGRLYDKVGPRPLVVVGFLILCVNTWQLSQLAALTSIRDILFLLALRGVAVGMTLQTNFTTAMSSVPRDLLPRGLSLQNSTRFVVQAVSVAALATVLSSTLSPATQQQQQTMLEATTQQTTHVQPFGVCETPGIAPADNVPTAIQTQPTAVQQQVRTQLDQVCAENISGFERTYRITFYAAVVALIIGAFLPGWPGRWLGRGSFQSSPAAVGGH